MKSTMHPTNNNSISRLWQLCRHENGNKSTYRFLAWPVAMSVKTEIEKTEVQVQVVDQTTHPPKCHIFVGLERQIGSSPPASFTEGRKRQKFYIYSDVPHTHTPGRSRVNPERQEEEKSGHKRRAKGQNSAGGEGNRRTSRTNLHGETDLTKTEHTPKPHDTLRRGTRGKLGTKWGTSW